MTADAKALTTSATPASQAPSAPATMPMADMRTFARALEQLGHDADTLLAEVGLSRDELNHPDGRVSCERVGSLIARAQQRRFTPNLGFAIAAATPLGAYPLLDYLVLTSDTVGDGLAQLSRYLRITESPVWLRLHADEDPIRLEMQSVSAFGYEFEAALIVLRMREETGGAFAAATIAFQHQPDDTAAMERALGCPVRTGASWNGMTVSRATCRLPLRRRDPILRRFLESLLDDVRKAAAGRYLDESTLAIGEIAYLLGYSEPAAFHRAFKRWYAATPEQFRARGRSR